MCVFVDAGKYKDFVVHLYSNDSLSVTWQAGKNDLQ